MGAVGFRCIVYRRRQQPWYYLASCRGVLGFKARDWVAIEDLKRTLHFVKEGAVLAPDARSSEKFIHGIKVLMAKNYVDNLSEEVKKGLREKAEQGHWPSVAPVGCMDNRTIHRIEVDPVRGPLVTSLFELYASGDYSLKGLVAKARAIGLTHPRSGRRMMKAEIHSILTKSTRGSFGGRADSIWAPMSRSYRVPRSTRSGPS